MKNALLLVATLLLAVTGCSSTEEAPQGPAAPSPTLETTPDVPAPEMPEVPAPSPEPAPAAAAGLVAIGDSYASGDGAPPYNEQACRRSPDAAPLKYALLAGIEGENLSCSGAVTSQAATQLQGAPADAAVVWISIGGNDLGFGGLYPCFFGQPGGCDAVRAAAENREAAVKADVTGLLQAARSKYPAARIVLVGYPDLVEAATTTESCAARGVPANPEILAVVKEWQQRLRVLQQEAAATAQVEHVDPSSTFQGHDLCSTEPWIIPPTQAGLVQYGTSIHPNPAGQAALAAAVAGQ